MTHRTLLAATAATVLAAAALFAAPTAGATDTPAAQAWESVLQNRLSAPNAQGVRTFDYRGFAASKTDRAALDAYIDSLAEAGEPSSPDAAVSYWANLYNAITVDVVADAYPVKSIRDIKPGLLSTGPWKEDRITVDGETLSLDDIEHGIMRARYPSPHIHYMVNCASIGCPNLQPELWEAATLDADRDAAAREYVNSPRAVRVKSNGDVVVSSIYRWFQEDFGRGRADVMNHIREYAEPALAAQLQGVSRYKDHEYSWALNE